MKLKLEGLVLLLLCAGCAKVDSLTCGEGTTRDGARCVGLPAITCANGTKLDNGTCVANIDACAAGTHLEAGRCIVDATACATGTTLVDGRCIVTPEQPVTTRWKQNVRVCPPSLRCYDGVVATDGLGAVYVAYSKEVTQGLAIGVAVSTDDGVTFAEKKLLEVTSRYALNPALAADENGNVVVAYTEYEPDQTGQSSGVGNLWLARSSDKGATWAATVTLTPQSDTTLDYKPMLSRVGSTLWVLFQRYTQTSAAMVLMKSTDLGATWGDPFDVPGDPGAYGQFDYAHGVSPLADGHLLLGYQSISYDTTGGGYVSQAGVLNVDPGSPGVAPTSVQTDLKKLAYTRDNRIDAQTVVAADASAAHQCTLFNDAPSRDYELFAVSGPISTETKAKELPLGPATQLGPSVALAANGDCHVAWLDNRRGGWELWSAKLLADGTLADQEPVSDKSFVEDGKNTITTLTGLVISGSSRYAVWNDTRDGMPAVYFARGPLDAPGM